MYFKPKTWAWRSFSKLWNVAVFSIQTRLLIPITTTTIWPASPIYINITEHLQHNCLRRNFGNLFTYIWWHWHEEKECKILGCLNFCSGRKLWMESPVALVQGKLAHDKDICVCQTPIQRKTICMESWSHDRWSKPKSSSWPSNLLIKLSWHFPNWILNDIWRGSPFGQVSLQVTFFAPELRQRTVPTTIPSWKEVFVAKSRGISCSKRIMEVGFCSPRLSDSFHK